MARARGSMPAPLASAAGRFEKWRRNRATRRIPEQLWTLAGEMAGRYGVSRTALALRVDYYDLKQRREEATGADARVPAAPSRFVELLGAPQEPATGCVVEFEDLRGARMRVHLKGGDAPDLVALGRLFLKRRA